jgi:hypothetical protein
MFYMAWRRTRRTRRKIRRYNIRAINTIERAQALGFMKTPRDNYNLFTLYYNIGQYGIGRRPPLQRPRRIRDDRLDPRQLAAPRRPTSRSTRTSRRSRS